MINLLLGAPGSGKSYEATVFHILPALIAGRKVITNLPLNVEAFCEYDPGFSKLIDLRTESKAPGVYTYKEAGSKSETRAWRPFEHEADYGDDWRSPEGRGPLYVIDEAHFCLPAKGTRRAVDEWFSMHRHEMADVLLITQSYGKISRAIVDLIQTVYRLRKNVALGSTSTYTQKKQDGVRGEVVSTVIRKYKREYFALYRSHTKGQSGEEANASDVVPIWKNWRFGLAGVLFLVVLYMFGSGKAGSPLKFSDQAKAPASPASVPGQFKGTPVPGQLPAQSASQAQPGQAPAPAAPASAASAPDEDRDPFEGKGLHLAGWAKMGERTIWAFVMSQSGQYVAPLTEEELMRAGYQWVPHSQCSGLLVWRNVKRKVVCDTPQQGGSMPNNPSHA